MIRDMNRLYKEWLNKQGVFRLEKKSVGNTTTISEITNGRWGSMASFLLSGSSGL